MRPNLLGVCLVYFDRLEIGADLSLSGIAVGPLLLACRPESFLIGRQNRIVLFNLLPRLTDRSLSGRQRIVSSVGIRRLGFLREGRDGKEKQDNECQPLPRLWFHQLDINRRGD